MARSTNWKKVFEIFIALVIVFVVIMIVFGALHFGFTHLKKTVSGNITFVENSQEIGTLGWVVIAILTAIIVVAILNILAKKDLFKIKWK